MSYIADDRVQQAYSPDISTYKDQVHNISIQYISK